MSLGALSQRAQAQGISLNALNADTYGDTWHRVCALLGWYPFLCHVHHCFLGEFPISDHHQSQVQTA